MLQRRQLLVKAAAALGVGITVGGLVLLAAAVVESEKSVKYVVDARSQDANFNVKSDLPSGTPVPDEFRRVCSNPLAAVEVERVLAIGDSANLELVVESDRPCWARISILAVAFELSPEAEIRREFPQGTTRIAWNISPKRAGSHVITLVAHDTAGDAAPAPEAQHKKIGITVKNEQLLNRWQSLLLSIVSSIGGPLLTVPWWIDWYRRRRQRAA
jgi:hypothetical protein